MCSTYRFIFMQTNSFSYKVLQEDSFWNRDTSFCRRIRFETEVQGFAGGLVLKQRYKVLQENSFWNRGARFSRRTRFETEAQGFAGELVLKQRHKVLQENSFWNKGTRFCGRTRLKQRHKVLQEDSFWNRATRFCTRTCFETDALGYWEMTYPQIPYDTVASEGNHFSKWL